MTWALLRAWRRRRAGHSLHLVCYHRSPRLHLPCVRWPTYDYRCGYHQDDP
jgi:hypothetical protein